MKVLLLGGTGAMGIYLRAMLAMRGDDVFVTSRRRCEENGVTFLRGDAKEEEFLKTVLSEGWDVVVDFMTWTVAQFEERAPFLLTAAGQYVFLSSYRVFAPSDSPLVEDSLRLLDSCNDDAYLKSDEYAIVKAREEDILKSSKYRNWTIIRPAITYSRAARFQLGTYEADIWLWRALKGLSVPLPREMMQKQCTLSWAGDVASMIMATVGSPEALGEDFNATSSQHQSWGDILEIYESFLPFPVEWVSVEEYERHAGKARDRFGYIPQVRYDRMVDRVCDNSKILGLLGLEQSGLSKVEDALPRELKAFLSSDEAILTPSSVVQGRLDRIAGIPLFEGSMRYLGHRMSDKAKYFAGRVGAW